MENEPQSEKSKKSVASSADNWEAHWSQLGSITEENPADRYRYDLVIDQLQISGDGAGTRILDIGCGEGTLLAAIAARFSKASIKGFDTSVVGVERASKKTPRAQIIVFDLFKDDVEKVVGLKGWATHAVCSEVIEHLDEPVQFLKQTKSLLATDGVFVATVPGGPLSEFHRYMGHRTHFTEAAIRSCFTSAGFAVESVLRAGFPFFNIYRIGTQLRGKKLIDDLGLNQSDASLSLPASAQKRPRNLRIALGILKPVFKLNLRNSRWGWQLVVRSRIQESII
ncbi:MAG: class I SAM-dependent methyltransferase [bacterium]